MMIESTLPRWEPGADTTGERPAAEQAAEIVAHAARLVRLKSRVTDLDALEGFAMALTNEIDEALARGAFCYFYQPIVAAESGVTEGHEALIRWQRGGEAVMPALFLPLAEETGAIRAIQQRLLDEVATACERLSRPSFISLNWSPRQFLKASAVSALIDRIKQLSIEPERIVIEITARSTTIDPDLVYFCIQLLKDTGVRIALDDFGGNYGSLAYLGRLPIDQVKLDAALIAELEQSERALRILSGVIDFAHSMGVRVIAKGVETRQQLRILRRLGCDLLQGHVVGSPAREPQIAKLDE
jgi:EAL domain-containing protein (putative c-di-GMP-specific phosphodiesterase class I)